VLLSIHEVYTSTTQLAHIKKPKKTHRKLQTHNSQNPQETLFCLFSKQKH
jgi:hypothetical protein